MDNIDRVFTQLTGKVNYEVYNLLRREPSKAQKILRSFYNMLDILKRTMDMESSQVTGMIDAPWHEPVNITDTVDDSYPFQTPEANLLVTQGFDGADTLALDPMLEPSFYSGLNTELGGLQQSNPFFNSNTFATDLAASQNNAVETSLPVMNLESPSLLPATAPDIVSLDVDVSQKKAPPVKFKRDLAMKIFDKLISGGAEGINLHISDTTYQLVRITMSIAHGGAFVFARDCLENIRGNSALPLLRESGSAKEVFIALKTLETSTLANALLRRLHLMNLHRIHQELYQKITLQRNKSFKGRISSLVLNELVLEFQKSWPCNRTESEPELRRRVANYLQYGKRWARMFKEFSISIIFLLPPRDILNKSIHNQRLEFLNTETLDDFLKFVEEKRGPFLRCVGKALSPKLEKIISGDDVSCRFVFEDIPAECFANAHLNSPKLIEYCAPIG